MTVLYADTSAVIRAYFADEPDHQRLSSLLFDGADPVITSELTRIEFASAVSAAARCTRIDNASQLLGRFDEDCGEDGPFTLLRLDSATVLPAARTFVTRLRLRTLDAIHLAVLMSDGVAVAGGDDIVLVTKDDQQADAARELGITVFPL